LIAFPFDRWMGSLMAWAMLWVLFSSFGVVPEVFWAALSKILAFSLEGIGGLVLVGAKGFRYTLDYDP
jgi:hypothetical protein